MKSFIIYLLILFSIHCGVFQVFQNKNLGNVNINNDQKAKIKILSSNQVSGTHCKYANFYHAPHPGIDHAFKDALKNSPKGTKGLEDVRVSFYIESGWSFLAYFLFPHLLGAPMYQVCYTVKGTPARMENE